MNKDKQEFMRKFADDEFTSFLEALDDEFNEREYIDEDKIWQWVESKKAEWQREALSEYFRQQREFDQKNCKHSAVVFDTDGATCELCSKKFTTGQLMHHLTENNLLTSPKESQNDN